MFVPKPTEKQPEPKKEEAKKPERNPSNHKDDGDKAVAATQPESAGCPLTDPTGILNPLNPLSPISVWDTTATPAPDSSSYNPGASTSYDSGGYDCGSSGCGGYW